MKNILAVLVVNLALVPARAQDLSGRWGVGGFAGGAFPAGSAFVRDNADPGPAFGGWVRRGLSERWGLGVSYDNLGFRDNGIRVEPILANVFRQFDPIAGLVPNVHGGAGLTRVNRVEAQRQNALGARLGAGVDYFLSEGVSVGAAADYHLAARRSGLGHEIHAFTVGLNVGLWLGRPASPAPVPRASAPSPVPPPAAPPAPARAAAPVAPSAPVSIELMIQFENDRAEIASRYDDQLEKVADFLKRHPASRAVIEGHTDSSGSAAHNKDLSSRRASAVRQALIDRFGADPERLSSQGYGPERPVAENTTQAGRARNRRVVAVFR